MVPHPQKLTSEKSSSSKASSKAYTPRAEKTKKASKSVSPPSASSPAPRPRNTPSVVLDSRSEDDVVSAPAQRPVPSPVSSQPSDWGGETSAEVTVVLQAHASPTSILGRSISADHSDSDSLLNADRTPRCKTLKPRKLSPHPPPAEVEVDQRHDLPRNIQILEVDTDQHCK